MTRQLFVVAHAEVGEKLDRGPVEVFTRIFRISRALKESPREQIAQGRGRIHAADIIYLSARGGAAVEYDGKHLKPRVPYFMPQLALEYFLYDRARFRSNGEARLGLRRDERYPASREAL